MSSPQLTDQDLFVHYPEGLMDMERALSEPKGEPIGGVSVRRVGSSFNTKKKPHYFQPNPCGRHPQSYYPHATHIEQSCLRVCTFKSSWAEASSLEG